jgi:hypothetical protein
MNININITEQMTHAVTLLARIREKMVRTMIEKPTILTGGFHGFTHTLQADSGK